MYFHSQTQNLCARLETAISSTKQEEDELHRDLKMITSQISGMKTELKSCEDLMNPDIQLAQQHQKCQHIAEGFPSLSNSLKHLKQRCAKLQSQSGSAGEASPLTKELRVVQKQTDGLGAQMKKLTDGIHDILQKRFTDRIALVQRNIAGCRDKLDWCTSEPSADRFGIESKLDALQSVEVTLTDAEEKMADVRTAATAFASISDSQRAEIESSLHLTEEKLRILREDCDDKRQSIDFSNDLLRRFEEISENASAWLRDVESAIRNETVSQAGLNELDGKIQSITDLHADIENHQPEIDDVKTLSEQVMNLMPESHVVHFSNHLAMRFTTALKFAQSCLTKQKSLQSGYQDYQTALQRMEAWLQSSDDQLRVHEKDVTAVPGSKPSLAYQSKLQALKQFMEQKDEGQSLLNQAVHAGDTLVPNITAEDKSVIRAALRNLRDRWESHLDQVNGLYKKVEGIILQLSSFDDSCRQIRRWIEETRKRLTQPHGEEEEEENSQPNILDVKEQLQTFRILAQDVLSHQSLISRLRERLQEISNPDAAATVDDIAASYQTLVDQSQQRVAVLEKQAADYDSYVYSIETFRDWLTGLSADLTLTEEGVTDKASAETKLRVISELLQQADEGQQLLGRCGSCLERCLQSAGPAVGPQDLQAEFETQKKNWLAFLTECQERNERLVAICSRWSAFEETAQALAQWLRQMESRVQDQALKATASAKKDHLEKLIHAQSEIAEKELEFTAILQLSQQIEGDSSLQVQVPQMSAKYQTLVGNVREMINRYQQYVKEHQEFNDSYADFMKKIEELAERLDSCREIVGDFKILQERRAELDRLQDRRIELDKSGDALADCGEKLYVHTGPDGREMLRVQLKVVRERWEAMCEDLASTATALDQCLQQFAEFSASQEQLTRWLREVEQSMLQHSDLKSTLQEKRAQLQSHKIVHQVQFLNFKFNSMKIIFNFKFRKFWPIKPW